MMVPLPGFLRMKGSTFGLLLLAHQLLFKVGLHRIPKVTLGVIVLQVGLFLKVIDLGWSQWPASRTCLSAIAVLETWRPELFFISALKHHSSIHLCYSMVSFAWKGMQLEKRMGSLSFLVLLTVLTLLTGVIYVASCAVVSAFVMDRWLNHICVVGFSGTLFALKVLVNSDSSEVEQRFGRYTVPKKLAPWLELIIIKALVPESSGMTHCSGIAAGLIVFQIQWIFRTFWTLLKSIPSTVACGAVLIAIHHNFVTTPWFHRTWWSSGTFSSCCVSSEAVLNDGQWLRLISAPVEHSGTVHLAMSLLSLTLKGWILERSSRSLLGLKLPAVAVSTTFLYVMLSKALSSLRGDRCCWEDLCMLGLSGPLFALKVKTLAMMTSWSPLLLFELGEMLILLERRGLLYHVSGLLVGLLWVGSEQLLIQKFPGTGIQLGWKAQNQAYHAKQQKVAKMDVGSSIPPPVPTSSFSRPSRRVGVTPAASDNNDPGTSIPPPGGPDVGEVRRRRIQRFGRL